MASFGIYSTLAQYLGEGVAEFLVAPKFITERSKTVANTKMFAALTKGTVFKMVIRFSGSRRTIVSASSMASLKIDDLTGMVTFLAQESSTLRLINSGETDPTYLAFPGSSRQVAIKAKQLSVVTADDNENMQIVKASPVFVLVFPKQTAKPVSEPLTFEPAPVKRTFLEDRMKDSEAQTVRQFGKSKIFITRANWALMEAMFASANANRELPSAILLAGPSGWGKTSMPEAFADEKKLKFLRIDCANVRDPEEWFGYREASDGSTLFVESEFVKAIREGNAIVVFDEVNRIEPWMANTLFSLLDHARRAVVHGNEVVVGDNVLFFATANIGGGFTGTFSLDKAFTNRFAVTIKVRPVSSAQETAILVERTGITKEIASVIVNIANAIRKYDEDMQIGIDISLRTTQKIANLIVNSKLGMMQIFDACLLNDINDGTTIKQILDLVRPILKAAEML